MMGRLARETDEGKKIAVVLDNARFHHAKVLNDLYAPGQALERITPIYMPPYAPDPGTHRTRTGRRQEQYRQPPRARPGEHLRGLHRLHHQPHLRLRLRAPPNHTTTHRSCLSPAIRSRSRQELEGCARRAPRTDLGAELNRSRRGTEPISARNRTDLGAEPDRSRRGTRPISAKGAGGGGASASGAAGSPPAHWPPRPVVATALMIWRWKSMNRIVRGRAAITAAAMVWA